MLEHLAFLFDLGELPLWGLVCLAGGSAGMVLAWCGWLWANRIGGRGDAEDGRGE